MHWFEQSCREGRKLSLGRVTGLYHVLGGCMPAASVME